MSDYPKVSTAVPVDFDLTDPDTGDLITGASDVTLRIQRVADGHWYDWSDDAFKAGGSVVDIDEPMPEVDATRAPGLYSATWPGGAAGTYRALVYRAGDRVSRPLPLYVGGLAAPGDAMDLVADAVDGTALAASAVTELQSGVATAVALAAVQADIDTLLAGSGGGGGPTAEEIRDAVLGASAAGHGAGTIGEAIGRVDVAVSTRSTLTAAQVDTQLSGTHGAGSWATATGFATSGAVADIPAAVQALILSDGVPIQGARIDAAISTRSTLAAADVWAVGTRTLTGIGTSGIASQASVSALPSTASIATAVAAAVPTAAQNADAVWDETLADHAAAGSAGAAAALVDTAVSSRASGAAVSALPSAAAIGAAVWATADTSPTAGTYGWDVKTSRMWITNRHEVDSAGGGRMRLWADGGGSVWLTWTLADGAGDAIDIPEGMPARRGAAV